MAHVCSGAVYNVGAIGAIGAIGVIGAGASCLVDRFGKKSVLASGKLDFLHEKVAAIDENAAKYHRQERGGKKRTQTATAKKPSTKKARTTRTKKDATDIAAAKPAILTAKKKPVGPRRRAKASVTQVTSVTKAQLLVVEEDEDYDESDGDT
ncbi:unnamed protein product [Peronospora effusa]|uniref:Uncharacterized protein n=1 Tax=Peronospora effusa TaxID=542832 RepID=A0A3M6VS43_9STRA|nr:hypothetical protein DD238_002727 [Peronospora effusa]RQM09264.1 hypothetical protein DD237_006846 [Peronospora effusa]CAI5701417.1 unnamed protein product [Peronospora effusa]